LKGGVRIQNKGGDNGRKGKDPRGVGEVIPAKKKRRKKKSLRSKLEPVFVALRRSGRAKRKRTLQKRENPHLVATARTLCGSMEGKRGGEKIRAELQRGGAGGGRAQKKKIRSQSPERQRDGAGLSGEMR